MTNKFSTKKFGASHHQEEEAPQKKEQTFVRDTSDNKLFKKYQVNNILDIITEDCIAYFDADTLYFQAAQNQENKFITVRHKTEGWEEELPGVKVFKGLGKGIKSGSWLHRKNIDREVEGLTPYTLEDFEVENGHRLKDDKDKCLEQAKMQVYMKLKHLRNQFQLKNIITVIGEGDNFRNELDLCRPYKGNRDKSLRPILLKELREWGIKELKAIETPISKTHGTIETDDYVDMQGYEGYLHFKKTGKFNKICLLSDKDGYNAPKIICNVDTYNKGHPQEGKFKYPQPTLVPDAGVDCGDIEMLVKEKSTEYKFIGFKGLLWQILTFDGADNYSSLGHLNGGMGYGAESAYKALKPCKTAKEALQKLIDIFGEVLPYGVQYETHKGETLDIPTLEYINTYFRVAYMLRNMEDSMDFYKLCKAFKVDTSKVENNNLLTPPVRTFIGDEENIISVQDIITSIISEDLKGLKTMKKADQAPIIDRIKERLESVSFEPQYQMIQKEK